MDHDESALMARLASINTRIGRFILGTLDRDAARPNPRGGDAAEGIALGNDLVLVGKEVRRHVRLRDAAWGHSYLDPTRGHIRAAGPTDGAATGPAVCGAWLVGDLSPASADFGACSVCLAHLAQES